MEVNTINKVKQEWSCTLHQCDFH